MLDICVNDPSAYCRVGFLYITTGSCWSKNDKISYTSIQLPELLISGIIRAFQCINGTEDSLRQLKTKLVLTYINK